MPAICIAGLHYCYPPAVRGADAPPVLCGIDLAVEEGEFLALMGPIGAGKTTLCLALNGLVPQATGGVIRGQVEVLGRNPRAVPVSEMATHVAMVFQDPESQLFRPTVEAEVAFGPENLAISPAEIRERVAWALAAVGMSTQASRSPAHLSGGQKQRVAIAAALAMLPDVLVLDEPTSGLDPVGQTEVYGVIEALCRERRMTILMVTQDAERAAAYADRVALLCQGRIAAVGSPRVIFADEDLLRTAGVEAPQVRRVASRLNRDWSTQYAFVDIDEAECALRRQIADARAARAHR